MALRDLEYRVAQLESQLSQLQAEVRSTNERERHGWRRAVEEFADDEDLLAIFSDATKLREAERKKARNGKAKARKS